MKDRVTGREKSEQLSSALGLKHRMTGEEGGGGEIKEAVCLKKIKTQKRRRDGQRAGRKA